MFALGELDINTFGMSICCFATRYLLALRAIDIFLAMLEIRYVSVGNECRLRLFLIAPQGISSALAPYRVADISSDASAAHIDVESSFETNDGLDVDQDSKRYKNRSKMGVETPKGIFLDYVSTLIISIFPMIWLLKLSSSSAGIHSSLW